MLAAAIAGSRAVADQPERTAATLASPADAEPLGNRPGRALEKLPPGNQVLLNALAALELRRSVFARVSHQTYWDGIELVGTGAYWQLASGGVRRSRLEMRTQVSGKTCSMLRVSDGRYLWMETTLPNSVRVERVDLKAYRESAPNVSLLQPHHLGGLLRLLASLHDHYEFAESRRAEMNGTPLFVLEGKLKANAAIASPGTEGPVAWRVVVAVGREGDYFPRLVEYYVGESPRVADRRSRPTLRMQWSEVAFDRFIDPGEFDYIPQDDWQDVTDAMLDRAAGGR